MASFSSYGMTSSTSPSGTAAAAQGKTDVTATSSIGVPALRDATISGSDCTRGLRPTNLVPADSLVHSTSPVPFSFLALVWTKLSQDDQVTVLCMLPLGITSKQEDMDARIERERVARAREREQARRTFDSVTTSISSTKADLEISMSEALKTRTIILERQEKGLAEIQSRLVALETRGRQLLEDISTPADPTPPMAPAARQPSSPMGPAARQPLAHVASAIRQPTNATTRRLPGRPRFQAYTPQTFCHRGRTDI